MEMFIDGRWTPSVSGATQGVTDPRSGAVFDIVPQGNAEDADIAIRSAHRAFQTWRAVPMADRVRLQKKLAQAMRDAADAVGRALHRELGRPLPACMQEVGRAADLLDIYAEEGLRLHSTMTSGGVGEKTVVTRDPVGVVVAITPFNYPLNLLMFKLGAALVAGCTVVAKPSADTPISTLMLAEIFHKAGLPAGVFNVVTGDWRCDGEPPNPTQGGLHRGYHGGQGDCRRRRANHETCHARTGRSIGGDRLCRCRHRQGRRGDCTARLREFGAVLLSGQSHLCRPRGLSSVP
jgi:acyl-CoA reductase-like NAD-dependent aldehyde dehydrogenase